MNPESRSGKPPSRGKKYPAFTCNLNNPEISRGNYLKQSYSYFKELLRRYKLVFSKYLWGPLNHLQM